MSYTKFFQKVPIKFLIVDSLVIIFSAYLSLFLKLNPSDFLRYQPILLNFLPFFLATYLTVLYFYGSYRAIWRYFTSKDTIRLVKAITLGTIIVMSISFLIPLPQHFSDFLLFLPGESLPRTIYIINANVLIIGLLASRLTIRVYYEYSNSRKSKGDLTIRTVIYGAGKNGRLLVQRFSADSMLGYQVIGFIDDDPLNHGRTIGGVKVLGGKNVLPGLLKKKEIQQIIVSMGSVPPELLRELVTIMRPYNLKPRIVQSLRNLESKNTLDLIREINFSDLLKRPTRDLDLTSVREMIKGKCVLVSGAGGSIGSELSRQILSHDPGRLILLDHSEYSLYKIDSELRFSTQETNKILPLLVDVKDREMLHSAILQYRPEIVFHAAAYKHVHLVETNPYSAILNNIGGTKNLIDICLKTNVTNFLLVSTDKAVNPAGIMGASKRVCEILTTIASVKSGQKYSSVRFGNVLGSSGSLIPALQKQIHEGGPITVTHPDMTRYFMLIPEAVSLVLKGATISSPGDINVLKMDEPIKIVELAKTLIALNGKTEEEVPIIFTGLRPGEKLFEELYIRGDELKTEHPDILTLPMGDAINVWKSAESNFIEKKIDQMIAYARVSDKHAVIELSDIVKSNYLNTMTTEKFN